MKKLLKEFPLSSWAIDHKTVIYVIMALFFFMGIRSKELCLAKVSRDQRHQNICLCCISWKYRRRH